MGTLSTNDRVVNNVDRMVPDGTSPTALTVLVGTVRTYVALAVATVVALAVLSATAARWTSDEAWGHAVVVLLFAVLLPLRLRGVRRGDPSAPRAVGVISAVVLVVNVVEASLPGFVPGWMRVEMLVTAALTAVGVGAAVRLSRRDRHRTPPPRSR